MSVDKKIGQLLQKKKKRLALAESCTGGAIAARLTGIAGASGYFLGAIVSYSDELKQTLLGVSETTLKKHGAVSSEVVLEMLLGLFAKTPCDYGLAISGIAGPTGGTKTAPIGTLWIAYGDRSEVRIECVMSKEKTRGKIIEYAVETSLSLLMGCL